MRALVTGVAGFIGSTLADVLVNLGWRVHGIDRFTAYYEEGTKRANLQALCSDASFQLTEADLLTADLGPLLDDVDVVFHLAGQPGVRLSWADGFATYVDLNIRVTQRLLEAARHRCLKRFVYASSSSVYGETASVPTGEDAPTRPFSPYGITKLAGELLCSAYGANFGLPTISLRYFTVYGPRQRPDMALHRMIEACLDARPFTMYGDGSQVRDFTYVDDVVRATISAGSTDVPPGAVMNVAAGGAATMNELVALVAQGVGRPLQIAWGSRQAGDVRATGGRIDLSRELLGWNPEVPLGEGIRRQVEWHVGRRQRR